MSCGCWICEVLDVEYARETPRPRVIAELESYRLTSCPEVEQKRRREWTGDGVMLGVTSRSEARKQLQRA